MQIEQRYVLVPSEPTEAMIDAGYVAYARKADDVWSVTPTEEPLAGGGAMGYAYRAMIAARPADSDMVERVKRELLNQTFSDGSPMIVQCGFVSRDMMGDYLARAAIAAMNNDT